MSDTKRALSPEANGSAGAVVKKQRTDDGALTPSSKSAAKEVRRCKARPYSERLLCEGANHCCTTDHVIRSGQQPAPPDSKALTAQAPLGLSSCAAHLPRRWGCQPFLSLSPGCISSHAGAGAHLGPACADHAADGARGRGVHSEVQPQRGRGCLRLARPPHLPVAHLRRVRELHDDQRWVGKC